MAKYNPLAEKLDHPWEAFSNDREQCPVHLLEHNGIKVYEVLSYKLMSEILRDPATFSSRYSPTPDPASYEKTQAGVPPVLTVADPPVHTPQRRLLVSAFSPRRVKAMEPHIESVANELIDAMPSHGGRFELVEGWARHLVLRIIMELLGVPMEDRDQFLHWTQVIEAAASSLETSDEYLQELGAFLQYIGTQVALREQDPNPPDDLTTALVKVPDEDKLQPGEIVMILVGVLAAGNSTTTSGIGNLVYLIETNPSQKAALLADLDLAGAAVDEGLRLDPPVHGVFRTATTATDVGGTPIPEGAHMFMCLGAGNHDPETFTRPDELDLTRDRRTNAGHLAFGSGIHHCVGSNLARLEMQIAVRTLYRRLPNLRMVENHRPHQINPMAMRTWSGIEMEYDGPVRPAAT